MTAVPGPGVDAPIEPVKAPASAVLAALAGARPMTVTELAAGAASGAVVKVVGRAAPGPQGPLRAPLSGAECVWYRSRTFQELRGAGNVVAPLVPINPLAPSDGPRRAADVRFEGRPQGSDVSSLPPFAISDGTGTVLIDPSSSDIDTDVFAVNEVVSDGTRHTAGVGPLQFSTDPFTGRVLHSEWVIPVGAELLAVGTVEQHGAGNTRLVAQGGGIVLVTTKPEQRIVSRSTAALDGPRLPFSGGRGLKIALYAGALAILLIVAVVVVLTVVP